MRALLKSILILVPQKALSRLIAHTGTEDRGVNSVPTELMSLAVREFGIAIDHTARPSDTRSGAGVHLARTPHGGAAYLKITPARLGAEALDRARRELRFYRQLATVVPVRTPPCLTHSKPALVSLCC